MANSSRQQDDGLGDRGRRREDDARSTPRVTALSTIKDYDVADGTPDPRGWTVIDAMRTDVGKVHDLIVDTVAMRTRYLDVELDKDATRLDDDRHVLIPVGLARLDDDHDRVVLAALTTTQLATLPPFTHEVIDPEYESSLLSRFDSSTTTEASAFGSSAPSSRDFYDNQHFDERSFFGSRRSPNVVDEQRARTKEQPTTSDRGAQADATSIRRRDEARQGSEPASTRQEEVTVERIPVVNADSAPRSDTDKDEIRIPVYEDEIVVTKRRVLKEEIVVNKRDAQEGRAGKGDEGKAKGDKSDQPRTTDR
jgi:photosynthetic reaction center H subunit